MFSSKIRRIIVLAVWGVLLPGILFAQSPLISKTNKEVRSSKNKNDLFSSNPSEQFNSRQNSEKNPFLAITDDDEFSTNVRIFSVKPKKGEGLGDLFIKSITIRLLENQSWFQSELLDGDGIEYGEVNQQVCRKALDNREFEDEISYKRRLVVKAAGSAVAEVMETTKFGKKLKFVEKSLSRFFVMEYHKKQSEEAQLILPGEKTDESQEIANDFKISIRSLVYASAVSFRGEFPIEMELVYFNTAAKTIYDFNKRRFNFSIHNQLINNMIGLDTELIQQYCADGDYAGMVKFNLDF